MPAGCRPRACSVFIRTGRAAGPRRRGTHHGALALGPPRPSPREVGSRRSRAHLRAADGLPSAWRAVAALARWGGGGHAEPLAEPRGGSAAPRWKRTSGRQKWAPADYKTDAKYVPRRPGPGRAARSISVAAPDYNPLPPPQRRSRRGGSRGGVISTESEATPSRLNKNNEIKLSDWCN